MQDLVNYFAWAVSGSFWRWAGSVILVSAIAGAIATAFRVGIVVGTTLIRRD